MGKIAGPVRVRRATVLGVAAVAAAVAALFAGCGSDEPASEAETAAEVPRYEIASLVLDRGSGPMLCAAGAMTSLPPQCEGPPVAGFDWASVPHDDVRGVRWGDYRLVGTWDGTSLTLTEPARVPEVDDRSDPGARGEGRLDASPPCPEPEGGWPSAPVTFEEWQAFRTRIQEPPDYAGSWVDQQTTVADPMKDVTTIAYTGDPEAHRAAIEAFWPNPICVVQRERTLAELQAIAEELLRPDGSGQTAFTLASGGIDEVRGVVELFVLVVGPGDQAALDERYGPGVVELHGMMEPVD